MTTGRASEFGRDFGLDPAPGNAIDEEPEARAQKLVDAVLSGADHRRTLRNQGLRPAPGIVQDPIQNPRV